MSAELMEVWRVEGPDGWGPYTGSGGIPGIGVAHDNPECKTPGPKQDSLEGGFSGIRFHEYCGFRTVERLVQWFTSGGDWLGKMADRGDFVVALDVISPEYVRQGREQLVYEKAQRVDRTEWELTHAWIVDHLPNACQSRYASATHDHDVKSTSALNEE